MTKDGDLLAEQFFLFHNRIDVLRSKACAALSAFSQSANVRLSPTPFSIVYQKDRIQLNHYPPMASIRHSVQTPLLIVYALINRETILDLQSNQSVVQTLLAEGFDLYMISWGDPAYNDRYLTIGDHVIGYINDAVDCIRKRCGVRRLNLMGICMGGTFSVMYAALYPEKVKNLVTTVTPVNFNTQAGLLHRWAEKMDVDKLVDAYGNIPGELLNYIFLLLNPMRLMVDKYIRFLEQSGDAGLVENFIRMERWIFDSPDIPGETFRQFIKDCYQQNLLIHNKMVLDGHPVDLGKITMPLLNIFARYDHLVPWEACSPLATAVGSADVENICLETGHIGIYVSRKSQPRFAPKIAVWLKLRDRPGSTVHRD